MNFDSQVVAETSHVERSGQQQQEGCNGVDALVHDWHGLGRLYVAPPVHLLRRVLRKIVDGRLEGVLTIPLWRGAKFWLAVFPDGVHAADVFTSMLVRRCSVAEWDFNPKNRLGRSNLSFLFLSFTSRGEGSLVSNVSARACIKRLFGQDCMC